MNDFKMDKRKQPRSQGPLLLGRARLGEDPGNEVEKRNYPENITWSTMGQQVALAKEVY